MVLAYIAVYRLLIQAMITIVDIPTDVYESIQQLIRQGRFSSLESFVELAISNQVKLEKASILAKQKDRHTNVKSSVSNDIILIGIPISPPAFVPSMIIEPEKKMKPIFGIVNRFAPAKLVVRMLANLLNQRQSQSMDFIEFSKTVAFKGAELKDKLGDLQGLSSRKGFSFDAGFPSSDTRSIQRFIDIYLGRPRPSDRAEGLIQELELASIKRDGEENKFGIGITESGYNWAKLHSPLIDDAIINNNMVEASFSSEEVTFLVSHLKNVRPGEYRFLRFTYDLISKGINTPDELYSEVMAYLKQRDIIGLNSITEAQVVTYRSGGVARLTELGLIGAEKERSRVKYFIKSEFP